MSLNKKILSTLMEDDNLFKPRRIDDREEKKKQEIERLESLYPGIKDIYFTYLEFGRTTDFGGDFLVWVYTKSTSKSNAVGLATIHGKKAILEKLENINFKKAELITTFSEKVVETKEEDTLIEFIDLIKDRKKDALNLLNGKLDKAFYIKEIGLYPFDTTGKSKWFEY